MIRSKTKSNLGNGRNHRADGHEQPPLVKHHPASYLVILANSNYFETMSKCEKMIEVPETLYGLMQIFCLAEKIGE